MKKEANRGATQVGEPGRRVLPRRGPLAVGRTPQRPVVFAATSYLPTAHGGFVVTQTASGRRLDSHHRATVAKIFGHPTSHNVQWHDVFSLLRGVGANVEIHEARFTVTTGAETEGFERPKGHDLDEQALIDLRRMLTDIGVTPRSIGAPADGASGRGRLDGRERSLARSVPS
jgi:hypothetical protein